MISKLVKCAGVLIVGLSLVGCGGAETGPARIAVSGSITGPAAVNGTISFLPTEGTKGPSATASIVNGKYRFDSTNGPVAGNYSVVIVPRRDVPKPPAGAASRAEGPVKSTPVKSTPGQAPTEAAPKPLAATVSATNKQHDFDVK